MTGYDLARLFGDKIDEGYSDYVNPVRKQRMFDAALIRTVEDVYMDMDSQKERDELSAITVLDQTLTINSNTFRTQPFAVVGVTFTGLIVTFTLNPEHNINVGDTFTVENVEGVTGVNITYTATATTANTVVAVDPGLAGTYTANSGRVTTSKMLSDYFHLLAIKCRMYKSDGGSTVDGWVTGTPSHFTTYRPNPFRDGDEVKLTNIVGITGAPDTAYVERINPFRLDLYQDENLTIPLTTSGTYSGGGKARKIHNKVATYQTPDEQISDTTIPTIRFPKVRQSRGYFNIYPTSHICDSVKVDYIRIPDIKIEVEDETLDLYNYYSPKFLERVVDEAVKEFQRFVKDLPAHQAAGNDIIVNP